MISLRDFVQSWQSLAKAKIYLATIVATLGITLGALVAMFNLNYQLLVKPLPYPDQERLFLLIGNILRGGQLDDKNEYSYPSLIKAYKDDDKYFEQKALVLFDRNVIRSLVDVPEVNLSYVTPEYLELAAATMVKGRRFNRDEGLDTQIAVALISYETWVEFYQQDPKILERYIRIDEVDFKIVGVTAQTFIEPQLMGPGRATQVWLPWDFNRTPSKYRNTWEWLDGNRYLVGKLNINRSPETVAQSITATLEQRFRSEIVGNPYWRDKSLLFELNSFQQVILGNNKTGLLLILAGTLTLVFIAAANIVNLLLARAVSQQRSMAIRAALGAHPMHLFKQILAETLLLVILSLVISFAVSLGLISLLKSALGQQLPRMAELYLDWPSIVFALLVSLLLAVGFASLVIRQMNYRSLNGQLQSGGKGTAIQVSPRVRRMLMVSQAMFGGLLLTFSIILLKTSLLHIQQPTGMLDENLVHIQLNEGTKSFASPQERQADLNAIYDELTKNPKIASAAFSSDVPLSMDSIPFYGYLSKSVDLQPQRRARFFVVDDKYLPMLGFQWIAGRNFTRSEMLAGAPVVIVNQIYARQWEADGEGSMIGRHLFWTNGRKDTAYEVVGVVADLTPPGAAEEPRMFVPGIYREPIILLQLSPGQELANKDINKLLANVNSQYKVARQLSMRKVHELLIAQDKLIAVVAAALSVIALGLVAIGLYGVVSYSLELRRFELGIRMAIGAPPRRLLLQLLPDNLIPVVLGLLFPLIFLVRFLFLAKPTEYFFELSAVDWVLPPLLILLLVTVITLRSVARVINQSAGAVLRNE